MRDFVGDPRCSCLSKGLRSLEEEKKIINAEMHRMRLTLKQSYENETKTDAIYKLVINN